MATANVKLYYGTALKPWLLTANKFFVIDDIASYLATFTPTELTNFQYLKPTLELNIVCDLSQTYTEPLLANGIKYVAIKNSDANKTYYYYVKNAEWRGKQSVKLYLVMDVANTFKSGTDFEFTERTKITREHKDRFTKNAVLPIYSGDVECVCTDGHIDTGDQIEFWDELTEENIRLLNAGKYTITNIKFFKLGVQIPSSEVSDINITLYWDEEGESTSISCWIEATTSPSNDGYLTCDFEIDFESDTATRLIDLQSEGLSPLLYKKEETLINRSGILNCDWFLLYRNQNNPTEALVNPVECYLIPSDEIAVNMGSIQTGGRINPENLELSKFYYIPLNYHQTETITLSDGTTLSYNAGNNHVVIAQKVDDTHIVVNTTMETTEGGIVYIRISNSLICEYFNISSLPCKYKIRASINNSYTYTSFTSDSFPNSWTSEGTTPLTLDSIDKLDRTDAKNIKLIKLPYVPYNFSVENNTMILTDTDFEHVSLSQSGGGIIEILKLKNLDVKFNYDFNLGLSPLDIFNMSISDEDLSLTKLRDDKFESKIYHSDYYQPKFVYDSFGYVFQLERMDMDFYSTIDNHSDMKIKYVVSTTINSRFMFQFIEYQSDVGKEDYNNVMPIARNNEIVLYNVPYINYIRTGYNYDVKSKQTQAVSTWASVGLGAVGTATALFFPSVALKVAGVVASLISTAISVKNAVVNQVQAERNLDQKMLEAKNQSTSISGSDDVDLMSVYTGNRAKMCKYECSDIIKQLLCDLFFYTGYVANRMGLPHLHTRRNFDYIEADIIITDKVNMSDEIMNELVGLYKNGLTFIHNVAARTSEPWDLEQKYENIELTMLS